MERPVEDSTSKSWCRFVSRALHLLVENFAFVLHALRSPLNQKCLQLATPPLAGQLQPRTKRNLLLLPLILMEPILIIWVGFQGLAASLGGIVSPLISVFSLQLRNRQCLDQLPNGLPLVVGPILLSKVRAVIKIETSIKAVLHLKNF